MNTRVLIYINKVYSPVYTIVYQSYRPIPLEQIYEKVDQETGVFMLGIRVSVRNLYIEMTPGTPLWKVIGIFFDTNFLQFIFRCLF